MKGQGIQRLNGRGKGNQIVHLKIEIPKEITPRQEELLREFDEESARGGNNLSGRIAQEAKSAFKKLFGKHKKKKEEAKVTEVDDDGKEEEEEKKHAAQ
jgi:DnaJ-class molecular chaperone